MEIKYVNNKGNSVYLDRLPFMLMSATDLFDYEWNYDTKNDRIPYNFHKELVKKKIKIRISGKDTDDFYNNLNELFEVFETDVAENKNGKLCCGKDYYLPCYIVKSSKSKLLHKNNSILEFEIVSDGMWVCEKGKSYMPIDIPSNYGKAYNYGYNYDYALSIGNTDTVSNTFFEPVDFEMIISGYANNPRITIAGNTYAFNCEVLDGQNAVINSKDKTLLLYKNDVVENIFSKRVKSDNNYIFEKIPSGDNRVYWNGDYNLTVKLFIERSEPEWT